MDAELMSAVAAIVEDVRRRGDAALIDYTERFDGVRLEPDALRVDEATLRRSAARVDVAVLDALREAIKRIRIFHQHERNETWTLETESGSRIGQRVTPIEIAGLYVPGGTASYPSSVVMNVVPAQVAGVGRIVVVTPPRTLAGNPSVAAALVELGVGEIYSVGGAQAIAALAYGTESLPRVDKITGPGNRYVAAAKKLVFGAVGIDSIAGPSEVVVLADATARASFVAADLLAQAEHAEDASAVLITTSEALASSVADEVARQIVDLPRRALIRESLARYGACIVVETLDEACALVNELAPEHLEIIAENEDALAERVRHAGAIFLGAQTPEAVGDYFAGPNHVLPTGGAARFSSALGVADFVRRTTMLRYSPVELTRDARQIAALAHAEGLDAHARSALIRLDDSDDGRWTMDDKSVAVAETVADEGGMADEAIVDDGSDDVSASSVERRASASSGVDGVSSVKPQVLELRAYSLTPERGEVKINQNENPWDVPARIKDETFRSLEGRAWSRYPDFVPSSLHEKLARFAGWKPEGVIAGNGSNELIQALLMVTVGQGKRVLISEPTFALYRQITTVLGGEIVSVPLNAKLEYDTRAIKRAIETNNPAVTIICSPNNPTGCRIGDDDLVAVLEASRGLVAVDEAYFEFAGRTVVPLLAHHPNLVVFRTFSKAMAMAALRVGYLLAAPELAREISKAVLPYNLNAVSQRAAEVAVENYEQELRPHVARIISERERVFGELQNIEGLSPVASSANFMVVCSDIKPREVFNDLLRRGGVLIRDVSGYPMLQDYFRISIGTPAENERMLTWLRHIFYGRTKGDARG
jgi:histidinol dehydrogenase